MALEWVTVPCLRDNFAYLIHDRASGETALIDAPEAAPILDALAARNWRLGQIFITHHHADHIQAVNAVQTATGALVLGAGADAHRLPPLSRALREGDSVHLGHEQGRVIEVPGHTLGHIAFHFPASALAFTADSLMVAGCGRLIEGSAAQMWHSLSKLAALPPETLIASGHDYLESNLAFARSLEPDNKALISRHEDMVRRHREGVPVSPVALAVELATNPFLRASLPQMKAAISYPEATDVEAFAEIRARKDRF